MNTPVEHVVEVSPDSVFRITGDGDGYVTLDLHDFDGWSASYMNRSEVNALIGALQNAVTFEWTDD